jgi:hypothetical protein
MGIDGYFELDFFSLITKRVFFLYDSDLNLDNRNNSEYG